MTEKRLNVSKWNQLRKLVETKGELGWFEFAGVNPLSDADRRTAYDTISRMGAQEALAWAQERFKNHPEAAYIQRDLGAVTALVAQGVTKESALKVLIDHRDLRMELMYMGIGLGGVFDKALFKGGAVDPATWLYVLRGARRSSRHLHGYLPKGATERVGVLTKEAEVAMLHAVMEKAPRLLGALMEDAPERIEEDSDMTAPLWRRLLNMFKRDEAVDADLPDPMV